MIIYGTEMEEQIRVGIEWQGQGGTEVGAE